MQNQNEAGKGNHQTDQENETGGHSRRAFLGATLGVTSVSLMAGNGGAFPVGQDTQSKSGVDDRRSRGTQSRAAEAAQLKRRAANDQYRETLTLPPQTNNGDEERYQDQNYLASFYKTLPQNEFGEVDPEAFRQLQRAMTTGEQRDFDRIPLAEGATAKLANPQGAFRFEMTGLDSHATRMLPAPSFRSAKTAAEMGEVYWQALTRDVPFINYNNSALIADAVNDLNGFSETVGPKQDGQVTAATLFRGETPGDVNGPYISQFLYQDIPYGPSTIVQRYPIPLAGQDFMTDAANWINVQRGGTPLETLNTDPTLKYLFDNRALGEYVHRDVLFQAYFNAALIILSYGGDAIDPNNPYLESSNQGSFTSLGGPWLLQLLTYASNLSLSGAWYHKWIVHRRLRPEVYGGRLHFQMTNQRAYEIHPDMLNSQAPARVNDLYGSYFLPMAYTEGSPTHPAYPAGHATIAGACCTVLKAFFNEDYVLTNTVQADETGENLVPYADTTLTLGGEIDKLANNISLGRDAAGVHYRSDGVYGLEVGEQQAITLLDEHVQTLNEEFSGLTLTKFNGEKITIAKR